MTMYPPSYRGPLPDRASRYVVTEADLLDAMRALGLGPRRSGDGWTARCPAHDDRSPSLSCSVRGGRLLLYCHAGCTFVSILSALGLRSGVPRSSPPRTAPARQIDPGEPSRPRIEWHAMSASGYDPSSHEPGLGLPAGSLARIGAVWVAAMGALAAPMYDAPGGTVIGVRLRAPDGRKWAVTGSHNGLFCPRSLTGRGALYLPEGMTDTAALAGLGLDAIGRPSCTGGRGLVRRAVCGMGRPLVVVTDADEPGRRGAETLARELASDGASVRVLAPLNGYRDVREWVRAGATASAIEYAAASRARV